jgi:hypothetical protein
MTREQRNAAKLNAALKGKQITRKKAKPEPLAHEETKLFPKACCGCGAPVTQKTGQVTRYTKARGWEVFCRFHCEAQKEAADQRLAPIGDHLTGATTPEA